MRHPLGGEDGSDGIIQSYMDAGKERRGADPPRDNGKGCKHGRGKSDCSPAAAVQQRRAVQELCGNSGRKIGAGSAKWVW